MNDNKPRNNKSITRTILLLGLALAYIALQPKLEAWLGVDLPGIGGENAAQNAPMQPESDTTPEEQGATVAESRIDVSPTTQQNSDGGSNQTQGSTSAALGVLTPEGRNFKSTAGLLYTPGSREGHRKDHVLQHAKDNLSKPVHGVFDEKSKVFALVDEAYEKVKNGSRDVRKQVEGNRTAYTVSMGRRVGFKGGRSGKQKNNPPTKRIKLILEGNRVITAYPY